MISIEAVAVAAATVSVAAGVLSTVKSWLSAVRRKAAERRLVTTVLQGTNEDMRRRLLEMGAQLERQPDNEGALRELKQFIERSVTAMNKLEQQQIVDALEQPSRRGQVNYTLKIIHEIEDKASV